MKIADFEIGSKTFIIAELSANHNGSLETALKSIKAAKEAGADAIKIQTYTADTLTLNSRKPDFMIEGGTLWDGKSLYELYQEAYTPWEWHKELFDYADELGIIMFSTPFDKSAVDFLESLGVPAYKIASFEITDYELIRYTASKGKPIIISTGIATLEEMEDVVKICHEVGNHEVILLKCTSEYPAPLEESNLVMIADMKERFGVEVGFSDHTIGSTAPIASVVLGAKVIEKHFIIDKSIGGADAGFSMEAGEFALMVRAIRDVEMMLGSVDYTMTPKKQKSRRFARSLYVSAPIKAGEPFTEENIKSVRPGYGLHPKKFKEVLGKLASKDYEVGDRLDVSIHK